MTNSNFHTNTEATIKLKTTVEDLIVLDFGKNSKLKKYKEMTNSGYVYIADNDIIKIYRKQYPNDTKTNDSKVDKMRKILDKELSQHRLYFDGDFGYKNQLDELEYWKNEALGVREEDKEKGREIYIDLIEQQKKLIFKDKTI